MKIDNFWDIEAWKEARILTKLIYEITGCSDFRKDYGLAGQTQRSAISVMANIAEGFERKTNNEFIQFLTIARGSNSELQSHLFIALDIGYISKEQFDVLFKRAKDIEKMLNGFITYLKKCG